jgi:riboflavin synthase
MFTGIVTDIGEITAVEPRAEGLARLVVACRYDPDTIEIGASIACSGVCLTAVAQGRTPSPPSPAKRVLQGVARPSSRAMDARERADAGGGIGRGWFAVDAAAETLRVTTAGNWRPGTRINLERALRVGDELGGHIVAGHVDGLAVLLARENLTDMARLAFRVEGELARFIAPKGSVALDGVSLTVNEVTDNTFSVLIIPHTLAVTTLGTLDVGARVNIEVDLMARYAARLMERPAT